METLKTIGTYIFGALIFIGVCVVLPAIFIVGGVWVAEKLLPWLFLLTWILAAINFLIFLPLALIPRTRGASGLCFYVSSYIYGATLWLSGLLLTYVLWGGFAVFLGLFLLGVGVVPFAILATLFKGLWGALFTLIVLCILTYVSRIGGFQLVENHAKKVAEDEYSYSLEE